MIKLRDGYQMLAAICKMVDYNKQPVLRPGHCECSFVNTLQYRHWKLSFVTHFRHNNIFISGWLTVPTAGPRQARAFLTNNLLSQKYYLKSIVYVLLQFYTFLKWLPFANTYLSKFFNYDHHWNEDNHVRQEAQLSPYPFAFTQHICFLFPSMEVYYTHSNFAVHMFQ